MSDFYLSQHEVKNWNSTQADLPSSEFEQCLISHGYNGHPIKSKRIERKNNLVDLYAIKLCANIFLFHGENKWKLYANIWWLLSISWKKLQGLGWHDVIKLVRYCVTIDFSYLTNKNLNSSLCIMKTWWDFIFCFTFHC